MVCLLLFVVCCVMGLFLAVCLPLAVIVTFFCFLPFVNRCLVFVVCRALRVECCMLFVVCCFGAC